MNKPTEKRRSRVTIAKADDPIYKRGWTITTTGVWGRLPKPYPELAEPIREAGNSSDKEGAREKE